MGHIRKSDFVASSGYFIDHREVSLEIDRLAPGTYTLVASTVRAGQEANFAITIFSNHSVEVERIPGSEEADEEGGEVV